MCVKERGRERECVCEREIFIIIFTVFIHCNHIDLNRDHFEGIFFLFGIFAL